MPALVLGGCQPSKIAVSGLAAQLLAAAHAQTRHWVWYDSKYSPLSYPNGDVPQDHGVCADVVIRAYRGIGIDLQKRVHEDMAANFDLYPKKWGLKAPDPNIDHRRVPNLRVFFARFGQSLSITHKGTDYRPGDILTSSPFGSPHISIVSENLGMFGVGDPMVIQNAGFGTREDNDLFRYPITGHYRYAI